MCTELKNFQKKIYTYISTLYPYSSQIRHSLPGQLVPNYLGKAVPSIRNDVITQQIN